MAELTDEQWDAIEVQREHLLSRELADANLIDALDALLATRPEPPKPVLTDGLYEEAGAVERWLWWVIDGQYGSIRNADGTLTYPTPLPDDASGWTRIRTLADDEVAVKRGDIESAISLLSRHNYDIAADALITAMQADR